jgi:hypothetical protein
VEFTTVIDTGDGIGKWKRVRALALRMLSRGGEKKKKKEKKKKTMKQSKCQKF